jgi:protein-tyrosine-phosphatase
MLRYWTSSPITKNAYGARRRSQRTDHTDRPGDVADPWYTGDFEATWRDVLEGCQGLLREAKLILYIPY